MQNLKRPSAAEAANVLRSSDTPTLILDDVGTIATVNGAWLELCRQHTLTRTDIDPLKRRPS